MNVAHVKINNGVELIRNIGANRKFIQFYRTDLNVNKTEFV